MKLRVLVVEDDAMVRDVLTTLLGFDGLEVVTASDGSIGLELATTIDPDVLVLDVGLPGMDGLELCRSVRESGSEIRIVMVSGRDGEGAELDGVAAGANIYLRKPFSPLELLDAIGIEEKGSGSQ
ncbi:MAG: response regulator transcription factor [Actinomycetota bacterium]